MRYLLLFILAGAVAGCATAPASNALAPITVQPSAAAATPTAPPSPVPTLVVQERVAAQLNIWMPETLAPLDNARAAELRAAWQDSFALLEPDVQVSIRVRRPTDTGGILATLRSASLVAPGALPDLALLRRGDLIAAAAAGLIQPLPAAAISAIDDDLPAALIALGTLDGVRYGLPYTLDALHLAYVPDAALDVPVNWRFVDVLTGSRPFIFPAARAVPMSDTVLTQYRAASSQALNGGSLGFDAEALRVVLDFYDAAVESGIIPPEVTTYSASTDYLARIIGDERALGVMSSSPFLSQRAQGVPLAFAPLPTHDGSMTTLIDGWMWVLTTTDLARQANALHWLDWMYEIDRYNDYMEAVAMLPTGRSVLRQYADAEYAAFIEALLERATLPLSETVGGALARAMQSALIAVLQGQRSAGQAVDDVAAVSVPAS
jgi:ABC-type glycerol-3-phosphate transport system substrate-binding protein